MSFCEFAQVGKQSFFSQLEINHVIHQPKTKSCRTCRPLKGPINKAGKVGQVKKQFETNVNPIREKQTKPKAGKVGQLKMNFEV